MVKVTAERIPDSQVRLNIEVEPERIERSVEKAYRRLAGQVNIPGFRRGKAPRHLVERFVGKDALFQEGLEQLLNEVYREAVQEMDLHPVDQPELDLEPKASDLKPGEALVVKATVPVRPTVELGDYHSIRVPRVEVQVGPEEVQAIVDRVQQQEAEWVPVERPVQEGDRVTLDVHGDVGTYARLYSSTGEPLVQSAGGKTIVDEKDTVFEVSKESKRFPAGFVDQVLGMTSDQEKQFELSLPADYPDAELANLTAIFKVAIHDVKEKHVPPVDDDLAKAVGYESLQLMRDDIQKQAQARAEDRARRVHEMSVVDQAIGISTIEIAPAMINREIDHLIEHAKEDLRAQRLDLAVYLRIINKSEDELREQFREQAVRNVKSALLLDRIAEQEGLSATPEEVDREIELMAAASGDQADRVRQTMSSPDRREAIEYRIRERKVVALLEGIAAGGDQAEGQPTETAAAEAQAAEAAEPESAVPAAEAEAGDAVGEEASTSAMEPDKE
jgi:trigger factor